MKKWLLLLFTALSLRVAAQTEIRFLGALSRIMRKADFSAHADPDTMLRKGLYALGPVEHLQGEMLILDGKLFVTSRSGDTLIHSNSGRKAAMLVYAEVRDWKRVLTRLRVEDLTALEHMVAQLASEQRIDTTRPFVFRIEGRVQKAGFHIIDWVKEVAHTMENHRQFAYSGTASSEDITLLGFYSDGHQGIFTHHTSKMHVHVLLHRSRTVAHLDSLRWLGPAQFYFAQ